jgi:hypothetical protein
MQDRTATLRQNNDPIDRKEFVVRVRVSDEEVIAHVAGFAVVRAVYEAEGYYDESADGDPAEEDMYRIEVLDSRSAVPAAEAWDGEPIETLADLGLSDSTLRRLFPAARWEPNPEAARLVEQYVLALAAALTRAHGPVARQRVLEASAGWTAAVIEDRFEALPDDWKSGPGPDD